MGRKRYAKYLRYSKVHGDREPDSIKNQELIIDNYVKKRIEETGESWILQDVYVDINYTGTNFMRPEFLRMKEDIEAAKIDVVISKDCSRFGRNVATEVYFSEIFPKHGVIFIGVVDNIDTSNDSQILERQLKGIVNESYSRDISTKVRSAMYAKMAEGKYVASCVPYGFLRDPNDKHKLIVDENVRPVILRITKLYLEGYGFQTIARILNDEPGGPPSPALYKEQKGLRYYNKNAQRGLWSISTVRKILTNEIYNGTLIQHRVAGISFKVKKKKKVPEEEQIKVEGAVEKIIDDETWGLIQGKIKMRSKVVKNSHTSKILPQNLYSGVVFCEDCGSQMNYRSDRDVYACGTYTKYGKKYCTNHYIKTKDINKVVLMQLEIINKLTIEVKQLYEDIKEKHQEKQTANIVFIKIKQCQKRIDTINNALKILREERADGEIDEDEYRKTRSEYMQEMDDLQNELGKLNNKAKNSSLVFLEWEEKIEDIEKTYEQYFSIKELDRELILRLIDKITISEDRRISEIRFKGESPFELAEELKQEMKAIAVR